MSKQVRKKRIEDALFNKWRGQIEAIQEDVAGALSRRRVWRELDAMFRKNETIQVSQEFFPWMRVLYWYSAILSIRWQLDSDPRTVSMRQLLRVIADQPHVLTRARVLALHDFRPGISTTETDPALIRMMEDSLAASREAQANAEIDRWAGKGWRQHSGEDRPSGPATS